MANKRLEREPDYNTKRRSGTGSVHLETCESCGYRIPNELDKYTGSHVPCSVYHVRCIRCQWPVAKDIIHETGLCELCLDERRRRNYKRRVKMYEDETTSSTCSTVSSNTTDKDIKSDVGEQIEEYGEQVDSDLQVSEEIGTRL